ncbi:cytochrome c [bacterium]|nr:cytochrome c [bacterium]
MTVLATGVSSILLLFSLGCAKQFPSTFPLSHYTRGQLTGETSPAGDRSFTLPSPIRAKVEETLDQAFPAPWTWTNQSELSVEQKTLIKGQQLYQQHCVHCHGLSGGGDGPTAASLIPRPRDFRRGIFKWKSTASRAKPTREDLVAILRDGAIGTSMPPFALLTDDKLNAMAEYVAYLSKRGELERQLLVIYSQEGSSQEELLANGESISDADKEDLLELIAETALEQKEVITESWQEAAESIVEAEDPASLGVPLDITSKEFEASVLKGRDVYRGDAGCKKCHGEDGRGVAGLNGADAVDLWGYPNPPRNLTLGLWRGGRQPIDLYRRIHEGIAGSSMPGQGSNPKVSKKDIWDLVNFLRVLPSRPELLSTGENPSPSVASTTNH